MQTYCFVAKVKPPFIRIMLESSLNRFVHYRVAICGLEMFDGVNRDTEEKDGDTE